MNQNSEDWKANLSFEMSFLPFSIIIELLWWVFYKLVLKGNISFHTFLAKKPDIQYILVKTHFSIRMMERPCKKMAAVLTRYSQKYKWVYMQSKSSVSGFAL